MSVTAAKPYVQKAYDEIKVIVNDANKQIRNFNLKTIAKIIAIVALFTLGGAFGIFACLKMGVAADIAGLVTLPFLVGGAFSVVQHLSNNESNRAQFIKNINEDINEKLKYPRSIKDAFAFNDESLSLLFMPGTKNIVSESGGFTISKIPLNSYDRVKKRYESDFRRHIRPRFLQPPKPSKNTTMIMTTLAATSLMAATVLNFAPKKV